MDTLRANVQQNNTVHSPLHYLSNQINKDEMEGHVIYIGEIGKTHTSFITNQCTRYFLLLHILGTCCSHHQGAISPRHAQCIL
jgi:hypothetical protein